MNIKKYFITLAFVVGIPIAILAGYVIAVLSFGGQMDADKFNFLPSLPGRTNVLVLGTDSGEFRSDVMIFASLDPKTDSLDIISIPRDTRVNIDGLYYKINSALALGKEELSVKMVKDIVGMPIHYYMNINFDAFRRVVDILGGMEYNVPQDMFYQDPVQNLYINLKKGQQHMDGDKAEQLVRFRHYPEGDIARIRVQQAFIKELIKQKLSSTYITKAPELLIEMSKYVKTNINPVDLPKFAGFAKKMSYEKVRTHQLPGNSKYIDNLSYFIADLEKTRSLVEGIKNGTLPTPTGKSEE